ncbi:MAG: dihydrodipicolinate synthase family protein [Acidobacteria bacterium]|nr:dihydrodipicolinate synthase family protein [Acidobacteriota bacterium]
MSRNKPIGGVISAALLPRGSQGRVLWDNFADSLLFLKKQGVAGICVNGATGEYAGATAEERRFTVHVARQVMGSEGLVVSGAGACALHDAICLAKDAETEGVDAHLVPAPHFFPYSQDDLGEFYRQFAAAVEKPVLLYNLASFTTGIDKPLAAELVRGVEKIAGIKDSSGRVDILEELTVGGPAECVRFVGNDAVFAECLSKGWCNGSISGVACVLPELILGLWEARTDPKGSAFENANRLLDEFIAQLGAWPVPWGLKLVAECRNLSPLSLPLPLSPARQAAAQGFRQWFEPWWPQALETLQSVRSIA